MGARVLLASVPAWDADARSIAGFPADGEVTFKTNDCVGIVCGLSSHNDTADYAEITHGFYVTGSVAHVMEAGHRIENIGNVVAGGNVYPYFRVTPGSTVFRIVRESGVIRYYLDEALVYTSLMPSVGSVFVGSALYAYDDAIIDLTVTPLPSDALEGALPPLMGGMADQDGDWLFSALPLLVGDLALDSADHLEGALPSLVGSMADADSDVLIGDLPPLSGQMSDEALLAPSMDRLEGPLPVLVGQMDEPRFAQDGLQGDLPPLMGGMGEIDGNWLFGALPPGESTLIVQESSFIYMAWPPWRIEIAQWGPDSRAMAGSLKLPLPRLSATLSRATISGHLRLPLPRLTARFGARLHGSLPVLRISGRITPKAVISGTLSLPLPSMTGQIVAHGQIHGSLHLPLPRLTVLTGIRLHGRLPALRITGRITQRHTLSGTLALPLPRLQGVIRSSGLITGSLTLPLPRLTLFSGGQGRLRLPLPRLTAYLTTAAEQAAAALSEVWLVNLQTGAVTTAQWGRFDRLASAHGTLYGLRDGTLYAVNADTPLTMTLRFASSDFKTGLLKRCEKIYLQCREANGAELTVVADEKTGWTYSTPTDAAPAYGSHKVDIGKGIRFHTLGLVVKNRNGGKLDLGGMELMVIPLSRRPR